MSQEDTREENQSLGSFLRKHRTEKGLSLEDAVEFTKISHHILRAIEGDDFDSMPAETFCRGFYSMYAKYLDLDPEEILARYQAERDLSPAHSKEQKQPPIKESYKFSSYAKPSPVTPGASLGTIFIVCLFLIAAVCWYFGWNPFSVFTDRANDSQPPVQEEQVVSPAVPVPSPEMNDQ